MLQLFILFFFHLSNVSQGFVNIRMKCSNFSLFFSFFFPSTNGNSLLFGCNKFLLMPNQLFRIFFSRTFYSELIKHRRDIDIISSFCTRNIFLHFLQFFARLENSSFRYWIHHSLRQGDVSRMIPDLLCYYLISIFVWNCIKHTRSHIINHQLYDRLYGSVDELTEWIHTIDDYYYHMKWQLAVSYSKSTIFEFFIFSTPVSIRCANVDRSKQDKMEFEKFYNIDPL